MWIVIFRDLFSEIPTPQYLRERDLLLSAWTTDALFYHARWIVFGNYPVADDRIPHPNYVVQQDGQFFVESFDGSEFRPASQHDVDRLRYRFSVGPIRLQEALLAHHGFGDWKPHYEEITVETAWKWTPI